MKRLFTVLAAVLLMASVFAQSPDKMSYQAVIRDSNNNLAGNTSVGMQISILKGSATGTPVYVERQFPTSNNNGLVSIEIGGNNATVVSGDFSDIDWSADTYFIKTDTDINGGSSYTISGTSQLLSVPYALHANVADSVVKESQTLAIQGSSLSISNGNSVSLPGSSSGNSLPVYTTVEIAALSPFTGDAVYNSTEGFYQVYDGSNWGSIPITCWPQPTPSNAGDNQIVTDGGVTTTLSANAPEAEHGTGEWSIVSGAGGSFDDPLNPTAIFNGVLKNVYSLRWTITTNCGSSSDEVTVSIVYGPYTIEYNEFDSHGWKAFVGFTFVSGKISEVDFDFLDADGNRKTEDAVYNENWLSIIGITNAEISYPEIESRIEATQIFPEYVEIDAVSGATYSTEAANNLMSIGIEAIKSGQSGTILIPQPAE